MAAAISPLAIAGAGGRRGQVRVVLGFAVVPFSPIGTVVEPVMAQCVEPTVAVFGLIRVVGMSSESSNPSPGSCGRCVMPGGHLASRAHRAFPRGRPASKRVQPLAQGSTSARPWPPVDRIFSTTAAGALARKCGVAELASGVGDLLLGGGEILAEPGCSRLPRRSSRWCPAARSPTPESSDTSKRGRACEPVARLSSRVSAAADVAARAGASGRRVARQRSAPGPVAPAAGPGRRGTAGSR